MEKMATEELVYCALLVLNRLRNRKFLDRVERDWLGIDLPPILLVVTRQRQAPATTDVALYLLGLHCRGPRKYEPGGTPRRQPRFPH
jgi:hypothetical protein